jgi:hydroxymethylpyrimidine pyrophosphatase-like HAD family hydrolase
VAELAAAAREVAGDAPSVAVSGEWVVEISAAGVNKAAALKELAADFGVEPGEVVAFGDYPNVWVANTRSEGANRLIGTHTLLEREPSF